MVIGGSHGHSCSLGSGRFTHYDPSCKKGSLGLNDLSVEALLVMIWPWSMNYLAHPEFIVKDPTGSRLSHGMSPWLTLGSFILGCYIHSAGGDVELAASRMISDYNTLPLQYHFVPLVFETLNPINNVGLDFITKLVPSHPCIWRIQRSMPSFQAPLSYDPVMLSHFQSTFIHARLDES